jgi:hypothetical protein
MKEKLITLATFSYPEQAYLVKTMLDAEGIWSMVADEAARTYALTSSGVRLLVRESDAQKAAQVIKE